MAHLTDRLTQDQPPVLHLAREAIDVSDPDRPLFPHGVKVIDVSKLIVALLYHPDDFTPGPTSLDSLLYGSEHHAHVQNKARALNNFVAALRVHLAKGQYILVRGWKPAFETGWDEDSVQAFKGSLYQPVEYQG